MTREAAGELLTRYRSRIDALDLRLVELLNERTAIVEEIGKVKRLARLEVYEPRREDSVLANAASGNRGPLSNEALRRIFERILEEMRAVQRRQIEAGECKP